MARLVTVVRFLRASWIRCPSNPHTQDLLL